MEIIQTISELQHIPKGGVQTIGNFDGVHIGHQEILAAAKKEAEKIRAAKKLAAQEPPPDERPKRITPS